MRAPKSRYKPFSRRPVCGGDLSIASTDSKVLNWIRSAQLRKIGYPPGQHWAYSNFGYCVLGRVIEKVSGQPYKDYVQQAVLTPCGITDMQIAGNTLKQRAHNEAMYVGQFGENPYDMNVARMDSHGGWI